MLAAGPLMARYISPFAFIATGGETPIRPPAGDCCQLRRTLRHRGRVQRHCADCAGVVVDPLISDWRDIIIIKSKRRYYTTPSQMRAVHSPDCARRAVLKPTALYEASTSFAWVVRIPESTRQPVFFKTRLIFGASSRSGPARILASTKSKCLRLIPSMLPMAR